MTNITEQKNTIETNTAEDVRKAAYRKEFCEIIKEWAGNNPEGTKTVNPTGDFKEFEDFVLDVSEAMSHLSSGRGAKNDAEMVAGIIKSSESSIYSIRTIISIMDEMLKAKLKEKPSSHPEQSAAQHLTENAAAKHTTIS